MSLDDDRISFYLRHRDQIEQWAALRSEAAVAIDEWLLGMRPEFEALASALGEDVVLHSIDGPDFDWPSFRLCRRSWPESDLPDPQASVSLEWCRARTFARGTAAPYVGLRSFKERALGTTLRARDDFRRRRAERKDLTSAYWAAYAYRVPTAPFPDNRGSYRELLATSVRDAWNAYAPIVDAAVAGDG